MNDNERIREIAETLGLADLPPAEQEELLAQVGGLIYDRVMRRVWVGLDIAKQDRLTELLSASAEAPEDAERSKAIESFLTSNVPELETYVAEEVAALKESQAQAENELADK